MLDTPPPNSEPFSKQSPVTVKGQDQAPVTPLCVIGAEVVPRPARETSFPE